MDSPQYYLDVDLPIDAVTKVLNLIINGQSSILQTLQNINYDMIVVLNLIINGQSSIQKIKDIEVDGELLSFKPYYKWIVLNTHKLIKLLQFYKVLNLIINGQSSIQMQKDKFININENIVLNLIINGQSSILKYYIIIISIVIKSFKPYYKWIVLNTINYMWKIFYCLVLNLIINGQSSIHYFDILDRVYL